MKHTNAAIQVICLGSGGGPSEDNVTGLLVRSTAANWVKGSVLAVDAGSHLAAITRIFEKDLPLVSAAPEPAPTCIDGDSLSSPTSSSPPPIAQSKTLPEPIVLENGPFAGLSLPHASARANAAHVVRSHVSTYLITHPHLDHLSGFAINTAAFHATSRPKILAALPFTVEAIKRHIFNDVIWPNLTDEDGGVGFVSFQRLREGGDVMVGQGEGRGYIEVCEGLGVKGFKVSHGNCMNPPPPPTGTRSQRGSLGNISELHHYSGFKSLDGRSLSIPHQTEIPSHYALPPTSNTFEQPIQPSVVDSTAYFIRDTATSTEVLIFGDVEPDSVSSAPRLSHIWTEAAPKIAEGILSGIFIECSYDDSQADAVLFGHMAPRHLVIELKLLAQMVREEKVARAANRAARKRKRSYNSLNAGVGVEEQKRSKSVVGRSSSMQPRRSSLPLSVPEEVVSPAGTPGELTSGLGGAGGGPTSGLGAGMEPPLLGVRVVVIHVKDTLEDGPHVGERILEQLNDHVAVLEAEGLGRLGCEFVISQSGVDYWF